jgi:hypothetical protein
MDPLFVLSDRTTSVPIEHARGVIRDALEERLPIAGRA